MHVFVVSVYFVPLLYIKRKEVAFLVLRFFLLFSISISLSFALLVSVLAFPWQIRVGLRSDSIIELFVSNCGNRKNEMKAEQPGRKRKTGRSNANAL